MRRILLGVLLVGVAVAGTFAYRVQAQTSAHQLQMERRIDSRLMLLVAEPTAPQAPAAAPAPPPGPVHVITFVDITPNNREAGTDLCKQYIVDTRKDAGVTRAELLVQSNRNNHMVLDVVFQNQAAYDRHVQAQHTKDFHAKLIPIIGSPFDERAHYVLQ